MFFLAFVVGAVGLYYYSVSGDKSPQSAAPAVVEVPQLAVDMAPRLAPNYATSPGDVLLNPHVPPLQANVYFPAPRVRGLPINIRTRGYETPYRQMGLLTRVNGPETILPLLGRMMDGARDQWQYYTIADKYNSVKLPISNNGRSCMNEYGCQSVSNGDTVYVEGYNDAFRITMYNNYLPRYIPYL